MSISAKSSAWRSAAAILLLGGLPGCAVGPDFGRPEAPPVSHYSAGTDPVATAAAAGTAQHFTPGGNVAADWWRLFKSPQLDAVMADALAHNPSLEAAQASLHQAQNDLRAGYGIFYPGLAAQLGAERQRFATAQFGENLPGPVFNLFSLSGTISYALDLFGGERRTVEGLAAQVDLRSATEQATYLTLSSNVAATVIAQAAYRAELEATERLIGFQRQQVQLAEIQAEAGTSPYSNVLSLRSQLASSEAALPPLRQKLTQSNDLLATLAGHLPAEWTPPAVRLADLSLPNDLPLSLPAELVRQRTDILVAEATAHTASANVGVATAALFPSLTLSGSYGADSTSASRIFAANGTFWSVGANLTAPVFDGGTLWYRRKAAIDGYRQAMASYRQVVLSAFAQVADTLRALDNDAAALHAADQALATAEQALGLVQANYAAGTATYLDLLNADAQFHRAQITDLQAIAVRYQDTVGLFAALGGGWWNAASPLGLGAK